MTLAYTGDVTLAYPQVVTDLPLPDTSSADVTVRMEMTNHAAVGRHVVLCGRIDGVTEFEYPVELAAGESRTVGVSPLRFRDCIWKIRGCGGRTVMAIRRCTTSICG